MKVEVDHANVDVDLDVVDQAEVDQVEVDDSCDYISMLSGVY